VHPSGETAGCGSPRLQGVAQVCPHLPVRRAPFVQWQAPLAWTTLSLTLHADGRVESKLSGASRFPRHWIYDHHGHLTQKSGLIDFRDWYRKSFGKHTPWGTRKPRPRHGGRDGTRTLALHPADAGRGQTKIRKVKRGTTLVRQGDEGSDVFLILDGVLRVDRDGDRLAEYGPGALLGERAHLEGGARTSSLVAITACRVATVPADQLDRSALEELSRAPSRKRGPGLIGCALISAVCAVRPRSRAGVRALRRVHVVHRVGSRRR